MQRGKRWWLVRLGLPVVAGLALLLWGLLGQFQAHLIIENRSGQPIVLLQISSGGKTRNLTDLAPGARVSVPVQATGADSFVVEGRLKDGTFLRGRFTHMDARAVVSVLPGGQLQVRQDGS